MRRGKLSLVGRTSGSLLTALCLLTICGPSPAATRKTPHAAAHYSVPRTAATHSRAVSRSSNRSVNRSYNRPAQHHQEYNRPGTAQHRQDHRGASHREARHGFGRGPHYGKHGHFGPDGNWVDNTDDPPFQDNEDLGPDASDNSQDDSQDQGADSQAPNNGVQQPAAAFNRSGQAIQIQFFSQSRKWVWPAADKVINLGDGKDDRYNLTCEPGEKICYGAWAVANPTYAWGVAHNNRTCPNCCFVCGKGPASYRFNP
jgi:hypothetical protein